MKTDHSTMDCCSACGAEKEEPCRGRYPGKLHAYRMGEHWAHIGRLGVLEKSRELEERKRGVYSEHLLHEACAGLNDVEWKARAFAFMVWCSRLDSLTPTQSSCPECAHPHARSGVCGEPLIGEGYPYCHICLCGVGKPTVVKTLTVLEHTELRYTYQWMDGAAEVVRELQGILRGRGELPPKTSQRVAQLLGETA